MKRLLNRLAAGACALAASSGAFAAFGAEAPGLTGAPVTVSWEFPRTGSCHEGLPFADGVTGVLVWGGGDTVNLTVGRGDLWDHRGGYPWTDAQSYTNIIALLERNDLAALKDLFRLEVPRGWNPEGNPFTARYNPYMLPLGRVKLTLRGATLKSGFLDTGTGLGRLALADGREIGLAFSKAARVFALHVPEGIDCRADVVPATDFPVYGGTLRGRGFERAARRATGFTWKLPADKPVSLDCESRPAADGKTFLVWTSRGETPRPSPDAAIGFASVRADSIAHWRRFWREGARVRVPDPAIQEIFDLGMYKFGAMTDPDGVAAGLQGQWLEDDRLVPWNGDYHFNINVQECYSPAFRGGHFANLMPLFRMILSWRPILRDNARKFVGIGDGYVLPHSVDDRGVCIGGFWTGTIDHASAAWMASYMFRYVKYSGDAAFLKAGAYDFMKGAMNVYLAMMEEHEGRLSIPLAPSPEWQGSNGRLAVGRDPSFQLAAAHRLAADLIEASKLVGEEPDARWLDLRRRLPLYTVFHRTKDSPPNLGVFCEGGIAIFEGTCLWESHRHHSHLAGIYPFATIPHTGRDLAAIGKTMDNWIERGTGLWSGWSVPWASILQTDAGNAVAAAQLLRDWKTYYNNPGHGSLHDAWERGFSQMYGRKTVMQMDGQCAAVAAVLELLVHEIDGKPVFFRGCPAAWKEVAFENVALSDGRRVSGVRRNGAAVVTDAAAAPGFRSDSGEATLALDGKGRLVSLKEAATGRELVGSAEPFAALVDKSGRLVPPLKMATTVDGALAFDFPGGARALLGVETFRGGWTFTVRAAEAAASARFRFASVGAVCRLYVGRFANMLSDEESAVALRAYEPELNMSIDAKNRLAVESDGLHDPVGRRFGLSAGRRSAIRGMLKEMTRVAGVPQTNAGGAWSLEAKENLGSYFMAHPTAASFDEWIALAELGGFDIFHYEGWQKGYGHYEARPSAFPNGDADLEKSIARIRARGMRLSAHTYTGFISFDDPWVKPKPHPNLMIYTSYTLARPFKAGDTELYVNEIPDGRHSFVIKYFSTGNVLRLGDELLQYEGLSREKPYRFTGVTRARFGTAAGGDYPAGTRCDYVFQRFYCFHPDIRSPFLGEVADTVMGRLDRFGFDRVYWDASDATGPYDTAVMRRRFAAACDQSKRPLQAEASSLGPHNWWFHSTVGAWDYPRWSFKRFHDSHIDYCKRECVKSNLMGPQLGWYSIGSHVHKPVPARDQRLDEVEYFSSRNAGANVAMSVNGDFYSSYATNPLPWRCGSALTLVGWYERFRMGGVLTDAARAQLDRPRAEFRLRQDATGAWTFTPAPCREHRAGTPETMAWRETFPEAGEGSVRVEALYGHGDAGSPRAVTVLDAARVPEMKRLAASGVTVDVAAAQDAAHGGVIALSATNRGKTAPRAVSSGAYLKIDRPYLDISTNGTDGAFVFWVKGDGSGALLNFMVESPSEYIEGRSERYVRLDFTGWRRIVADLHERDSEEHDDYFWSFDWHIHEYPIYRDNVDTKHVSKIGFYFNDLAKGRTARVEIGEVRYVQTRELALEKGVVTVNGAAIAVPFALRSGEAAQLEKGFWTKYDGRGDPIARRPADARVALKAGANDVSFAGGRAQVTLFGTGRPFPALAARDAWSADARRRLAFEATLPEVYRPSAGLGTLAPVVTRPGETARLAVSITGAIAEPTLTVTDPSGAAVTCRFPVRMAPNDMLSCEDGARWKVVRRVLGGARKTIAEGVLETPLPQAKGSCRVALSTSDEASARAIVQFVKRYSKENDR